MRLVALGTKITEADKKSLEVLAISKGMTVSKLARDLIELGLHTYTVIEQTDQIKAEINELKKQIAEAKSLDNRRQSQLLATFDAWFMALSKRLIPDPGEYRELIRQIKQSVDSQKGKGGSDVPQA